MSSDPCIENSGCGARVGYDVNCRDFNHMRAVRPVVQSNPVTADEHSRAEDCTVATVVPNRETRSFTATWNERVARCI
jgi:hypothetical protein